MSSKKTLCISFSRQSTGEVRFWIAAMSHAYINTAHVELMVDGGFQGLFKDYIGDLSYQVNPRRMSENAIAKRLLEIGSQYQRVVMLDLTSVCLENRIPTLKAKKILEALCTLAKDGVQVAVFDPMGVLEKNADRHSKRVHDAAVASDKFMEAYNAKVGPNSNYRCYYFGRYLKERTLSQLLLVPEPIQIYRSLPYNDPALASDADIRHFNLRFESCARVAKVDKRKVLLALSGFASNAADKKTLSDLLGHVIDRLHRLCGYQRFIVIDPMALLRVTRDGVEVRWVRRMPRNEFLAELKDLGLCAAFIPTSTVGITAIQNGIPFVSFFSSRDSDEFVDHGVSSDFIPRFTSLGIWEDFAFLNHLRTRDTAYLNAVEMVDIAEDHNFVDLSGRISSGYLDEKIKRYSDIAESSEITTLAELLGG